MSQYYNSNQAYNSAHNQKDGVANGAIIGGLAGAGVLAGAQFGGDKILGGRVKSQLKNRRDALRVDRDHTSGRKVLDDKGIEKMEKAYVRSDDKLQSAKKLRKNFNEKNNAYLGKGGNWKTRTAMYAGSALAGMGAGAGIDAMNK